MLRCIRMSFLHLWPWDLGNFSALEHFSSCPWASSLSLWPLCSMRNALGADKCPGPLRQRYENCLYSTLLSLNLENSTTLTAIYVCRNLSTEIQLPFQVPQQLAAQHERRPQVRPRSLRLRDLLLPAESSSHAVESQR